LKIIDNRLYLIIDSFIKFEYIGASFEILVVSDIPISCCFEKVGHYYTYESIYKGTDANDEGVQQIQE
jgi:hypothetical protein